MPKPTAGSAAVLLLHKPMNVLSQFTSEGGWPGLDGFGLPEGVYAAGRLDRDSEGLLVLTGDGRLQARIADPRAKLAKTYLVQVEGEPSAEALAAVSSGVDLRDGRTAPAAAEAISDPGLPPRDPPIRMRKTIPDAWLRLTITEGRNRQVRRMCAAVGLPCLRLVRIAVGPWSLGDLAPGAWREAPVPPELRRPAAHGITAPRRGRR
ncbi:MAG: pseudouridine synthase [Shimia sp.]